MADNQYIFNFDVSGMDRCARLWYDKQNGIEIDILDGRLVYLGEYVGESPWTDHSKESWNAAAHVD